MRYIYFFMLCVLLFIFSSCEKTYIFADTKIKGKVFDSTTFERVSGASVTVYKNVDCPVLGADLCDRWEAVKTVTTDKNGEYLMKFNDNNREYRMSTSKDGYYKTGWWYKVSKNVDYLDLYLFPQTILSLEVKNVVPGNEEDVLNLEVENHGNRDVEIIPYHFSGSDVDTTIDVTVYGNFTHVVNWEIQTIDTTLSYNQSIHCSCEEENVVEVFY